jgi:hypothetical protein
LWTRDAFNQQQKQSPCPEALEQPPTEPLSAQANPTYTDVNNPFFGDSTETLQKLIRVLLDTNTAATNDAIL